MHCVIAESSCTTTAPPPLRVPGTVVAALCCEERGEGGAAEATQPPRLPTQPPKLHPSRCHHQLAATERDRRIDHRRI
jgi:hypothetical protein